MSSTKVAARWSMVLGVVATLGGSGAARADKPRDPDAVPRTALARDALVVTDGSGHYVVTSLTERDRLFYGDGKTFWEQRIQGAGASLGEGDYNWTIWAPQTTSGATIQLVDGKAWSVSCGDRVTPMVALDEQETRKVLDKAAFRKPLWKRRAIALARDERGRYYYVDRLLDEHGGKGLRLFVGKTGRLAEQRLIDTIDDTAGVILETRRGELHVEYAKESAAWVKGKVRTPLIWVPVYDNRVLIYTDLGAYRGRLGVPCDDL